ncbi:MAG: nickel-responsive transcriptional regulator NikR [Candidatus Hydrogenedentes bacterium]|nr:nickel-responsive transcriptional regulator NikR [Candidatus Hydrogenedentota bacterium]
MSELERLSFSIEKPLSTKLEKLVRAAKYTNRSEYIRDLIRSRLVEQEWETDKEALGTVTLLYDHHTRGLSDRLTRLQHDFHSHILATTHVHLDHDICAEVIMIRGKANLIRQLAAAMGREKGVLHASLSLSSTGKQLA